MMKRIFTRIGRFFRADIPCFFKITIPMFLDECSEGTKLLLAIIGGVIGFWILFFLYFWAVTLVSNNPIEFRWSQPHEEIVSIEVVHIPGDNFRSSEGLDTIVICSEVSPAQFDALIHELESIPCYAYGHDPREWVEGGGFRVTYSDGSYELISQCGSITYDPSDTPAVTHHHVYFDEESFAAILNAYSYQEP